MYYLIGKEETVKTLILLSAKNNDSIKDIYALKRDYIDFLRSFCDSDVVPAADFNQYCFDKNRINSLIEKYNYKCNLTDLDTSVEFDTPLSSMQLALEKVKEGQARIKNVNPNLYSLFQIVVHTLFYSRSMNSGGGTVSSAPGVIWCANRKSWSIIDVSEFLVHEFTHNMVFLDERRYQHYLDLSLLSQEKYYAMSAILNKLRPLDKVFHSLVVAHEILKFREQTGEPDAIIVHPKSDKIVASCLRTIESLEKIIYKYGEILVTDRFVNIVGMIKKNILQMSKRTVVV